jgi:hypothetical protein
VDYGKIDAALAAALEEVRERPEVARKQDARKDDARKRQRLSVFVHLDPEATPRDRAALTGFGLPDAVLRKRSTIATATLTPDDIAELSEQPCVRQLRLSTPLRLLGDGQ